MSKVFEKTFFLVTSFFLLAVSCNNSKPVTTEPDSIEISIETEKEEKPVRHTLTFVAAGDNLFHETLINSSLKNGVYDFDPIYSEIKPIVKNADLAFINQETVMAGERYGYSGFPTFNTPQSLAKTLADAGFAVVNMANNHALDMGESGLLATLAHWDTIEGITIIGTRRLGEEKQKIITKNNITLGFLGYAHDLNGFALPRHNPDLVSMINRTKMAQEIDALRPLCDFLIVSVHWGNEYLFQPVKSQTDLAAFFAEHNVDLVIGHHPHVLEPFEAIPRPDGKETYCFYSLGNFVSNQRGKERILGAMIAATFVKEGDELFISDSGLIPVVCHFDRNFNGTVVYPLYSYNEELLKKHQSMTIDKDLSMDFFYSVIKELGTKIFMYNPFMRN
ncbi:MAG: CapA family protein [Treponema sp.]|jgi:poly-gamma-glutamate synthesis protein (capsule biosynthesis protein)|nr:CapA family protein [Treponema sp.]